MFALLSRSTAPPLALGLVVAVLLIAGESALVYVFAVTVHGSTSGAVFLLGVLVVAMLWGFRLGAITALATAIVYLFFHRLSTGAAISTGMQSWVATTLFLVIALSVAAVANVARSRATEADLSRRQIEISHRELTVVAEQQSALRRVATLVARAASLTEVFEAVADEMARCLHVMHAMVSRYDAVGFSPVAIYDGNRVQVVPAGLCLTLDGDNVAARVFRTGQAARMDSHDHAAGAYAEYIRELGICSAVGAPIVVGGCVWGVAIIGSSTPEPLPPGTEARMADFTDLMATAIEGARTRAELAVLAEQQAALRRVATLVARGVAPTEVFSTVALELARVLHAENASVWRYEPDGAATLLSAWDAPGAKKMPVGQRFSLDGESIAAEVLRTESPARMDSHDDAAGPAAAQIRELGLRGGVGVPIIVDARLWGVAVVGTLRRDPLPADTEGRVRGFADLVATAIANAQTHAELTASRVRIVAAADDARRRIERDLHDGAQQRLVSLGLELRTAAAHVPPDLKPLKEHISRLATTVVGVSADLQELSRGIHPAILSNGGLAAALKTLARRSTVPVELVVKVDQQLPEPVEVAIYYIVAEALTNAAKHAQASSVDVRVDTDDAGVCLSIRDDGVGGADTGKGSGLIGLTDRVEAIGGKMTVSSPLGSGTALLVTIPREIR